MNWIINRKPTAADAHNGKVIGRSFSDNDPLTNERGGTSATWDNGVFANGDWAWRRLPEFYGEGYEEATGTVEKGDEYFDHGWMRITNPDWIGKTYESRPNYAYRRKMRTLTENDERRGKGYGDWVKIGPRNGSLGMTVEQAHRVWHTEEFRFAEYRLTAEDERRNTGNWEPMGPTNGAIGMTLEEAHKSFPPVRFRRAGVSEWIKTSEQAPTEADTVKGYVQVVLPGGTIPTCTKWNNLAGATHWRRIVMPEEEKLVLTDGEGKKREVVRKGDFIVVGGDSVPISVVKDIVARAKPIRLFGAYDVEFPGGGAVKVGCMVISKAQLEAIAKL